MLVSRTSHPFCAAAITEPYKPEGRGFLRDYELIVIYDIGRVPELSSAYIDAVAERISAHGGEVNSVSSWGKRKFAYPINNQREGHYVLLKFSCDSTQLGELEQSLRLFEDVARFLITREDEDVAAAEAAAAVAEASA